MCLKEVILDVTFQDRISGSDRVVPNFERSMKLTINSLLFCVLELKLFRLFFFGFFFQRIFSPFSGIPFRQFLLPRIARLLKDFRSWTFT